MDRTLAEGGYAPAAMFQLATEGFTSVFEQLVACIISIRTFDETSLPAAQRLFALARTPREMMRLTVAEIDEAIGTSTFHEAKARQILEIAGSAERDHGGELPCDAETLMAFRGVGPKCANLALGIACGQTRISVDIHVHRVTNRWGIVAERTPEATLAALESVLPKRYWIEINRLLVPFGKHVCTGRLPKCSTCPVLDMCRQVGVTSHR
ncbi:MAG: endonuclease III [Gemmatimonadota bacterium]